MSKKKDLKLITVQFTEAQLDAIYDAMADFQDYGDEEQEIADSIRDTLCALK